MCDAAYSGLALKAGQHPDLAPSKVVERPRVLFNDGTRRFVMWMHIDEADYKLAHCGVASAAAPQGPYSYHGSFRPHGHMCRDFTLFKVRNLDKPKVRRNFLWFRSATMAASGRMGTCVPGFLPCSRWVLGVGQRPPQ